MLFSFVLVMFNPTYGVAKRLGNKCHNMVFIFFFDYYYCFGKKAVGLLKGIYSLSH